jgi:hypothetical protein
MLSVVLNEEIVEVEEASLHDLAHSSTNNLPQKSQQDMPHGSMPGIQCLSDDAGHLPTTFCPVPYAVHTPPVVATASLPGQLAFCLQGSAIVTLDSATMHTMMSGALLCNKPRTSLLIFQALVKHHVQPSVGVVNLVLHALAQLGEWMLAWQVLRSSLCGVGIDIKSTDIMMRLLQNACCMANEQHSRLVPHIHQIMDEIFCLRRALEH